MMRTLNNMKQMIIIFMAIALTACSFSGFEPPRESSQWIYPGRGDKVNATTEEFLEYVRFVHKAMLECGIDPNVGSTTSVKESLCMEEKGWRDTDGWTCEQDMFKNDPLCDDWRSKHNINLIQKEQ